MSQIDLSQLPAPEIVQQLDAVIIRTRMLARYAELKQVDAPKTGDPLYFAFSAMAEEITRARQEFQDISLENMVAFASGNNLQQLGALRPVERFDSESDDQYRRRVQMAPEGFSTAGPEGAYIFHALSADGDVLDAYPDSPDGFKINLYILSRSGDGTASQSLIDSVTDTVNATKIRPLNDDVSVLSAEINSYRIEVELEMPLGPGETETMAIAKQRLQQLADETHVLGGKVALSAIDAAAHVQKQGTDIVSFQPVTDVTIVTPNQSIECTSAQAPFCTEIIVRKSGEKTL
ncbi:baseplate J/gp47 family protein [Vibrio sp. PP-XX7]